MSADEDYLLALRLQEELNNSDEEEVNETDLLVNWIQAVDVNELISGTNNAQAKIFKRSRRLELHPKSGSSRVGNDRSDARHSFAIWCIRHQIFPIKTEVRRIGMEQTNVHVCRHLLLSEKSTRNGHHHSFEWTVIEASNKTESDWNASGKYMWMSRCSWSDCLPSFLARNDSRIFVHFEYSWGQWRPWTEFR